jgi:hypothetical protein
MLLRDGYPFDPEKLNFSLQKIIEGKWVEKDRWIEKDGVIYFTLISNGMTGEEWISYFKSMDFEIDDYAEAILRGKDFKPTKAGTFHNIAVLKGTLFSDDERMVKKICAKANKNNMKKLPLNVVCLIRDKFTDGEIKEMGLERILVMHEPLFPLSNEPRVLCCTSNSYIYGLCGHLYSCSSRMFINEGFAFEVA